MECYNNSNKNVIFQLLFFRFEQLGTHTLIERGRICTARPRVGDDNFLRGVRDGSWEFTTLEEGNVETQVEHMLKTVVYVNSTCVLLYCVFFFGDQ